MIPFDDYCRFLGLLYIFVMARYTEVLDWCKNITTDNNCISGSDYLGFALRFGEKREGNCRDSQIKLVKNPDYL
ncbi:hypothetical protein [Butyrivibrio sp. AE3003]|uniref:hypothetical protein n=1 Tax=Butyrivibrio sp. AE3003 TaxID=1496721 RepID=UPI001A98299D|nr:hypothetical protein [Butyrivibrio sp. AE3003]